MNLDYRYDTPGGDDFEDVTHIFHNAAEGKQLSALPSYVYEPTLAV